MQAPKYDQAKTEDHNMAALMDGMRHLSLLTLEYEFLTAVSNGLSLLFNLTLPSFIIIPWPIMLREKEKK
jgi:hypothetical protein